MATKKKMLQAAAGNAAASGGAGGLNVEQVFSTYLYDGNGGTQVIENGINLGQSYGSGGIYFPDGDGDYLQTATLPALSGEFTFELWFYSYDTDRAINLLFHDGASTNLQIKTDYLSSSGNIYVQAAGTSFTFSGTGYTDPDGWNHIAVVRNSANRITCFLNGTRRSTQSPISATIPSSTYSIGSDSTGASASGYELMYGYMSSVRISDTARYDPTSASITVPTSAFTSDSNTVLLLGQGDTPLADASSNSYSVTVNGNPRASEVGPFDAADAGEGGLVWFKQRNGTYNHVIFDTERWTSSNGQGLFTNATNAAGNINELASFNANGFTVQSSGYINDSVSDMASWTFRKAPKFFDVVTYTGTGSARTISHNLGTTVGTILIKKTSAAADWIVYHRSTGATDYLELNTTNAVGTYDMWNNTAPTSTEFSLSSYDKVNQSGATYVAYLFAHNDGDGTFGPTGDQDVIRCGSYTGTGSSNFIDLGFEPQWVLVKKTSGTAAWELSDNMRGLVGGYLTMLEPNSSSAEVNAATSSAFSPNPTGMTIDGGGSSTNQSGASYIYIAIRRGPMAVPTDATDVFAIDQGINSSVGDRVFNAGFPVDLMIRTDPTTAYNRLTIDRLRGNGKFVATNLTDVEADTAYGGELDDMESVFTDTAFDFSNHYAYMWQRRPSFCDVVAYTGNSTADRAVSHNLTVPPEMIWVKSRSNAYSWYVYHKDLGATKFLELDGSGAASTGTLWTSTPFTDTAFYLNGAGAVNGSGSTYIAYLFASLDGVSKVGSFTHTSGTATNVDCGFSNGARFVLLKYYDQVSDWWVFDTVRGIAVGNDARLILNQPYAETSTDQIDPYSAGFTYDAARASGDIIFYAIA